jgi:hypothetical protein
MMGSCTCQLDDCQSEAAAHLVYLGIVLVIPFPAKFRQDSALILIEIVVIC